MEPLLPSTPVRGDSLLEWLSGASSHLALSFHPLDSDERAPSVTERRQYHRVVPGKPHNAQTSTHWPSFIVNTLWSVSRFNVQTAVEELVCHAAIQTLEPVVLACIGRRRRLDNTVHALQPHHIAIRHRLDKLLENLPRHLLLDDQLLAPQVGCQDCV